MYHPPKALDPGLPHADSIPWGGTSLAHLSVDLNACLHVGL